MMHMPKWQNFLVSTQQPIFTPEQCDAIIDIGRKEKIQEAKIGNSEYNNNNSKLDYSTRITNVSFIPFNKIPPMYDKLEEVITNINLNYFMFDGIKLNEFAQYTEYNEGGFYDWHMDSHISGIEGPTNRKISMTCLLSDPSEFEGGDLLFSEVHKGKAPIKLKRGQAVFFASFLRHKVDTVTKGNRKSLVVWFGGPPFK